MSELARPSTPPTLSGPNRSPTPTRCFLGPSRRYDPFTRSFMSLVPGQGRPAAPRSNPTPLRSPLTTTPHPLTYSRPRRHLGRRSLAYAMPPLEPLPRPRARTAPLTSLAFALGRSRRVRTLKTARDSMCRSPQAQTQPQPSAPPHPLPTPPTLTAARCKIWQGLARMARHAQMAYSAR